MKRKDAIKELDEACKMLKKQSEAKQTRYFVTSVIATVAFCLGVRKMGDYAYSAGRKDGARSMANAIKTDFERGSLRRNDPDWDDE